jgi:hypothetical protein
MDISQAAYGLDMWSASRIYFVNPVLNPQVEKQAIGRARRISQNRKVTVETLVLRGSLEEVVVRRKGELSAAEHSRLKSILDDGLIYEWIRGARVGEMPELQGDGDGKGKEIAADINGDGPGDLYAHVSGVRETALLQRPVNVFGKGAGREAHPDEDLVMGNESLPNFHHQQTNSAKPTQNGDVKMTDLSGPGSGSAAIPRPSSSLFGGRISGLGKKRKVGFAGIDTLSEVSSSTGTPGPSTSSSEANNGVIGNSDTASGVEERPARRVRFAGGDDDDE